MAALKPGRPDQSPLSEWAGFAAWAVEMNKARYDPALQQDLLAQIPEGYVWSAAEANEDRAALIDHADLIDAILAAISINGQIDLSNKENTGVAQNLVDVLESTLRDGAVDAVTLNSINVAIEALAIADIAGLQSALSTAQASANAAQSDADTALSDAAAALARANHTGTQLLSTISDAGALAALSTVGTAQIDNLAVTEGKLATALQSKINASSAPSKLDATTAPGTTNDINDSVNASDGIGFVVGSVWIDTTANEAYRCVDSTDGAAVWISTTLETSELGALALLSTVGTTEIDDDAVTYAKLQNVAADGVILGNVAGAGSVVDELTATEVRTLLNVEDGALARPSGTTAQMEANTTSLLWSNTDTGKIEFRDTVTDPWQPIDTDGPEPALEWDEASYAAPSMVAVQQVLTTTAVSLATRTPPANGTTVTLFGYYVVGDTTSPWSMIYRSTGRSGITVNGGFLIAGSGADDYYEAVDKTSIKALRWGCVTGDSPSNATINDPVIAAMCVQANTVAWSDMYFEGGAIYVYSQDIYLYGSAGGGSGIRGDKTGTELRYTGTGYAIQIGNGTDGSGSRSIANLSILAWVSGAYSTIAQGGIYSNYGTRLNIFNVNITGFKNPTGGRRGVGSFGIQINYAWIINIRDCKITNCVWGIDLKEGSSVNAINIDTVMIEHITNDAIIIAGAISVDISGQCTIEAIGGHGIYCDYANSININGCYFESTNSSSGTATVCIDDINANAINIENNYFGTNYTDHDIHLIGVRNCQIKGNSYQGGKTIGNFRCKGGWDTQNVYYQSNTVKSRPHTQVNNCSTTAGSPTLTTTGTFTSALVGQFFHIKTSSVSYGDFEVITFVDANTITLGSNVPVTGTGNYVARPYKEVVLDAPLKVGTIEDESRSLIYRGTEQLDAP